MTGVADGAFDLVVIGSGPGGYVSAIRAAQLGMRVACVEKYPTLGGTCLNVGCIPSKALLDSSEHFSLARHGLAAHGIQVSPTLDLGAMMKRKDGVVRDLTRGIEGLFRKNKIERLTGTARIVDAGTVEVAGAEAARRVATRRILIATGSKPAMLPGIAIDDARIVHSTHALALPAVPKRLTVVGAGAIGLELGSVWLRLGSEVTVIEIADRILPGMDAGTAALLQKILTRQGMRFELGASVAGAHAAGDGVTLTVRSPAGPPAGAPAGAPAEGGSGSGSGDASSERTCDVLLVAIGRRPFTDGLGLEEAGVTRDERGRVLVDAEYATNIPGIFAIGDVIAGPMLAHKAEEEGIAAVERMAGLAGHVAYDCIPNVVYTWPELASVGWSEEEAKRRGVAFRSGVFPFLANGRARAMGERDGQVKILADAATDRILGAHILGPRGSDLIAEVAVAMEMEASAEDVARSVHAHPTLPEAIKEAAMAVSGRAIHI